MRTALFSCVATLLIGGPLACGSEETPPPSLEEGLPAASPAAAEQPLVSHEKLTAFLPEPPPEWRGEAPQGSTTENETIRLSTARRLYVKGDAEDAPTAIITILDSASNGSYFETAPADWKTNTENADGFDRRITLEGMPAFEHYDRKARTGSLSVFVGGRYFVQVELTNLDPVHLRDWFKRIDSRGLAALK